MFEKQSAVRLAAYLGILAAVGLGIVGLMVMNEFRSINPLHMTDTESAMVAAAASFPRAFFMTALFLILDLCAGFFFLGLAVRAARLHPTSATIGGGLLVASVTVSFIADVWGVFGGPLAAVAWDTVTDVRARTILQTHFQTANWVSAFFIAAAISLAIPGFTAISYATRALKGRDRLVAPAFLLAATTQFLSVLTIGYVFHSTRVEHALNRTFLMLAALGAWSGPVLAFAIGAIWLLAQSRAAAPAAEPARA